jgi:hypothetical protein
MPAFHSVSRQHGGFAGMGRRAFVLGVPAAAVLPPMMAFAGTEKISVPDANTLAFQVSRNGAPIGTHRLDFDRRGRDITVRIGAAFRVGFSFVTLYRYRHDGVEQWRDGAFQSLETETNDNGRVFRVHARRVQSGILIQATGLPDRLAPAEALPLTHWAVAGMAAPLFNPQTGAMLRETAQPRGAGTVALANGRPIAATRFALAGETPIQDWYDESDVWAALDGTAKDGSRIAYRRS